MQWTCALIAVALKQLVALKFLHSISGSVGVYTTFSTRTNNNHKRRGTVATATQQRTGTALLLWRVLRTLSSWWCALGLAELDKAAVRSKSMVA